MPNFSRPYTPAYSQITSAHDDDGTQTAYTAGLSYFPDYTMAFEPMGDVSSIVNGVSVGSAGGPAGSVAGGILGALSSFMGGAAVDAQRAARVQYFLNQASQGNVAAAQLIIAAPGNVSGNEQSMWNAAISALGGTTVGQATLATARAAGPVWFKNSGDTATNYPVMKNFTSQWAMTNQPITAIAQGVVNGITGATGARPVSISPNLTPLLLLGAAGTAAYFMFGRRRGR